MSGAELGLAVVAAIDGCLRSALRRNELLYITRLT